MNHAHKLDHTPFLVRPGTTVRIADFDAGYTAGLDNKREGKAALSEDVEALAAAQRRLYADDRFSLLVVFQAMDAAGKDGTIRHVMSGVNPQGCEVHSFKAPSADELDHTFLWRCMKRLPQRGRIGIFNRSYYEEVLVVRVHPEWLDAQRLPPGPRGDKFWQQRYDDINAFERHLVENGTHVVKFFLNVSKKEQRQRFLARLNEPEKNWKFEAADVRERRCWDAYMKAYEQMLAGTSTEWAPWYVIPADHKWFMRAAVADILVAKIESLELKYPTVTDDQRAEMAEARRELEAEG